MERLQTTRQLAAQRRTGTAAVTTDKRLIASATALLDAGGESAVTLRAVGHASGISHNAPYKHFKSRDALLAAVATTDFVWLADTFRAVRHGASAPASKLTQALKVIVHFSVEHPARYRLLFNDPEIAAVGGDLEVSARSAFAEFLGIVQDCQAAQKLPAVPDIALAGLLFATTHGLIGLAASGRMHPEKGLSSVESSLKMLVSLLQVSGTKLPGS